MCHSCVWCMFVCHTCVPSKEYTIIFLNTYIFLAFENMLAVHMCIRVCSASEKSIWSFHFTTHAYQNSWHVRYPPPPPHSTHTQHAVAKSQKTTIHLSTQLDAHMTTVDMLYTHLQMQSAGRYFMYMWIRVYMYTSIRVCVDMCVCVCVCVCICWDAHTREHATRLVHDTCWHAVRPFVHKVGG